GHSQPGVFFDRYDDKEADLDALGLLPATVGVGDNQQTRGEVILHFLEERWVGARLHIPSTSDPRFNADAHLRAIAVQNLYREDLGQTITVVSQDDSLDAFTGDDSVITSFSNGATEAYPVNGNGNVGGPGIYVP